MWLTKYVHCPSQILLIGFSKIYFSITEVRLLNILPSSNACRLMHPLDKYNPAEMTPRA